MAEVIKACSASDLTVGNTVKKARLVRISRVVLHWRSSLYPALSGAVYRGQARNLHVAGGELTWGGLEGAAGEGSRPVWVRACRWSSSLRVNLLPQKNQLQTKGRSPVCRRT